MRRGARPTPLPPDAFHPRPPASTRLFEQAATAPKGLTVLWNGWTPLRKLEAMADHVPREEVPSSAFGLQSTDLSSTVGINSHVGFRLAICGTAHTIHNHQTNRCKPPYDSPFTAPHPRPDRTNSTTDPTDRPASELVVTPTPAPNHPLRHQNQTEPQGTGSDRCPVQTPSRRFTLNGIHPRGALRRTGTASTETYLLYLPPP